MTRQDAEAMAADYTQRWAGSGWSYIARETERTLLGEPDFGGWYVKRIRTIHLELEARQR